jgi:hypothetical protein
MKHPSKCFSKIETSVQIQPSSKQGIIGQESLPAQKTRLPDQLQFSFKAALAFLAQAQEL